MLRWVGFTLGALVVLVAAYVFVLSGSFHQPTERFVPAAGGGRVGPVIVFGGNRGTGLEIVRRLRERGETVTVAVRPGSDTSQARALGADIVVADALRSEQVAAAFSGGAFHAVVSTLGTSRRGEPRPDFDGNRNVIDAARSAGARRFVLLTVIGAGNSHEAAPLPARLALREVMALRTRAEDYLRASGLAWTVIRPGGLGRGRATGTAFLSEDPLAFSYISRNDLADLAVRALLDPRSAGHTFAAYDPGRRVLWNLLVD
jgi:uncharacterized protein YbjT (DUF2867 family)